MTKPFADHFSSHAAEYARFRPDYPESLFDWLASIVDRRRIAWDCATGNGQAALSLAERFDTVVATDASAAQLSEARRRANVHYVRAVAESCPLRDSSVDLVTVAQAMHWFDLDAFYAEVGRVVVPGGAIVVWSYALMTVDPAIDALVDRLYRDTLDGWWPPERRHVDEGYRSLRFPFAPIEHPSLEMTREWSLAELLGYIDTWSAFQRFARARGREALDEFAARVAAAWGAPDRRRTVRWPLAIRAGRTSGE